MGGASPPSGSTWRPRRASAKASPASAGSACTGVRSARSASDCPSVYDRQPIESSTPTDLSRHRWIRSQWGGAGPVQADRVLPPGYADGGGGPDCGDGDGGGLAVSSTRRATEARMAQRPLRDECLHLSSC
eukprot:scaffold5064_cov115-Isochrysis_galbana.AAC.7